MNTSALVLAIVQGLNILAIITVVFFQRKESSTRLAWILVLSLIPVGGFFLYLFFGHDYRRKERLKYSDAATIQIHQYISQQIARARDDKFANPHFAQLAHLNLVTSQAPLSHDNKVTIFNQGRDKFEALLNDLRGAESYIHLLYFIFRTDELGQEILEILAQKAEAGVDVKVVYDDVGNLTVSGRGFKGLKKAGGQVFRYSPMFTSLFSANYRNHRKLAIIDGRVGYVGGMNIGREYIEGRGRLKPWRDTHLRIEGSAVWAMEAAFLPDYVYAANKKDVVDDWRRFISPVSDEPGGVEAQFVTSEPQLDRYHLHQAYVKMISSARDSVYIQTPYLVPDKTILDSLSIALGSGVDVRLMLPLHPDKLFVWYASLDYARHLAALGAKIYLYDGFIHSKVMIADGQVVSIGSANFDVRSFFLSYEANVFLYDEKLAVRQQDQFFRDINASRPADEEYFKAASFPTRAMMPLCRLFSPLL